jgi:hypothetical protein
MIVNSSGQIVSETVHDHEIEPRQAPGVALFQIGGVAVLAVGAGVPRGLGGEAGAAGDGDVLAGDVGGGGGGDELGDFAGGAEAAEGDAGGDGPGDLGPRLGRQAVLGPDRGVDRAGTGWLTGSRAG